MKKPDFKKFLTNFRIVAYLEKINTEVSIVEQIQNYSIEEWIDVDGHVPNEFKNLPNYIAAQEILNSPLKKALEENEQLTDSPQKTRKKKETGA